MIKYLFFLTFAIATLCADEETVSRRIYAHLVIKDESGALEEVEAALKNYPSSKIVQQAAIKAFAKLGQEEKMMKAWYTYLEAFPEDFESSDLLEAMAWGVIAKGSHSPSPFIRIISLISAFFANDAQSVDVICRGLGDPNSIVRQVAVEVASEMRDARLCDKILAMLSQEKDWAVRVSAIDAVGKMQIMEAESTLISLVGHPHTSLEEKAVATKALLLMLENVQRQEIEKLAKSERAELRALSAKLVGHLAAREHLDLMLLLLRDTHPEVRKSALQAIGILKPQKPAPVSPLLEDSEAEVAITAAWVMTLSGDNPAKLT